MRSCCLTLRPWKYQSNAPPRHARPKSFHLAIFLVLFIPSSPVILRLFLSLALFLHPFLSFPLSLSLLFPVCLDTSSSTSLHLFLFLFLFHFQCLSIMPSLLHTTSLREPHPLHPLHPLAHLNPPQNSQEIPRFARPDQTSPRADTQSEEASRRTRRVQ